MLGKITTKQHDVTTRKQLANNRVIPVTYVANIIIIKLNHEDDIWFFPLYTFFRRFSRSF